MLLSRMGPAARPSRASAAAVPRAAPCAARAAPPRASAAATDAPADGAPAAAPPPPGRRFEVTLPKPVGVVFSQKDGGPVFIESVVPGGHADKAGILVRRWGRWAVDAGGLGPSARCSGHGSSVHSLSSSAAACPHTHPLPSRLPPASPPQPGDILSGCSAVTLKAGMEGRYERVGHGDRPYDNWEVGGGAVGRVEGGGVEGGVGG
jgi:hypothetical protein